MSEAHDPTEALQALVDGRRIWRGSEPQSIGQPKVATGHPELDELLGGGWPQGGITEILSDHQGLGELSLCMPALAALSQGDRWVAWVAPPYIPYAPALEYWGLRIASVLWVHKRPERDTLWALEQALRSGTCAAVLGWLPKVQHAHLRRLQLAAEAGGSVGILFRPAAAAEEASPASLRLQLSPAAGGIKLQVLKQRGQWAKHELQLSRWRLQRPKQ